MYFGGGTPSLMPVKFIAQLVKAVRSRFITTAELEVSVEANPGTVDPRYLEELLLAGVNRLSFGFQTLNDGLLTTFRRAHLAADSLHAFRLAREAGFSNINVDLMYALPGQTLEAWKRDLETVLELQPEHISAYQLTVHEGTVLYKQVVAGMVQLPDSDLAADMYLLACEMLAKAGYDHYEIANWGRRPCLHNLIYWRREPYIGFGAGAHSFVHDIRYWNVAHPARYIASVLAKGVALDNWEEASGPVGAAERIMLGLRLRQGLDDRELEATHPTVRSKTAEALGTFQRFGLAQHRDGRWRLTERGWLVANWLFEKVLP